METKSKLVLQGLVYAFTGILAFTALLIIFPPITKDLLSLPDYLSIPIGLLFLVLASIIFRFCVREEKATVDEVFR